MSQQLYIYHVFRIYTYYHIQIYSIATSQNYNTSILLELYLLVQFPALSSDHTRSWFYIVFYVNKESLILIGLIRVTGCRGKFLKRPFVQGEKRRRE